MDGREYLIQSVYDHKTLTAMSRVLRKTQRRVWSVIARVFGWGLVGALAALNLLLAALGAFIMDFDEFLILLVMALLTALLLGEDHLNAWIAAWQIVPGTREAETRFTDRSYTCTTQAAVTEWKYENIRLACETKEYFVLFLSKRHGQVYPKSGFRQGAVEDFRTFLAEKTGKEVRLVK